jgi:ATP-dependent helicase HepA
VLVDHQRQDLSLELPRAAYAGALQETAATALLEQPGFRETLLPRMIATAQSLARQKLPERIARARKAMAARLGPEHARLEALQKINPAVRPEEINLLARQREELDQHLAKARLRLDGLRLIQRG